MPSWGEEDLCRCINKERGDETMVEGKWAVLCVIHNSLKSFPGILTIYFFALIKKYIEDKT